MIEERTDIERHRMDSVIDIADPASNEIIILIGPVSRIGKISFYVSQNLPWPVYKPFSSVSVHSLLV